MGFERLLANVDDARSNGWFVEGSVSDTEMEFLESLARRDGVRRIVEIGFNAGFSSHAFLRADPQVEVTSFDLGDHEYVATAKQCIDDEFPGRHTLITGDSTETVPAFAAENAGETFDVLFIDGGHTYEVAATDIANMARLAHENSVVMIDDLLPHKAFGEGPVRAWREAIEKSIVVETDLYQDGEVVDTVTTDAARAWAIGHYA
ncbi:class I SAM-dependent methyltransferase [Williamsia sp. M5A3_1d]